jgi:hypothetical protein
MILITILLTAALGQGPDLTAETATELARKLRQRAAKGVSDAPAFAPTRDSFEVIERDALNPDDIMVRFHTAPPMDTGGSTSKRTKE